jgi:hypothetical protein
MTARPISPSDDLEPDESLEDTVRESYAGILTGVYGRDAAEREAYIRGERDACPQAIVPAFSSRESATTLALRSGVVRLMMKARFEKRRNQQVP